VLGASSYTYAEVTLDEQLASWIGAHVRAFEFFQGTPKLVVPDNAKTGVTKACRYDPDLNPTYQEMAMHYGVGVVPARPCRPRDKTKAESGVLLAERWIIAALRHRKFFSIEELNQASVSCATASISGRFASAKVHAHRSSWRWINRIEPSSRRAFRSQPVVPRPCEHRLPHRLRHELLQRPLQPGARAGGSALDTDDHRAFL